MSYLRPPRKSKIHLEQGRLNIRSDFSVRGGAGQRSSSGSFSWAEALKTPGSLAVRSEDSAIERDEKVENALFRAGNLKLSSLNNSALSLSSSTSNTAPGIVETKTLSLPIRLEHTTIVANSYTGTPETYYTAFGSTILAPRRSAVTHPTIYRNAVVLAHPSAIDAQIPASTTSVLLTGYGSATYTSNLEDRTSKLQRRIL
ncbi:hypothetical protein PQX77_011595 [Marasmius sp. AFHP31]|nr:hypothetical protein PQX77_011595 [Marasmius sp. AFHP31]